MRYAEHSRAFNKVYALIIAAPFPLNYSRSNSPSVLLGIYCEIDGNNSVLIIIACFPHIIVVVKRKSYFINSRVFKVSVGMTCGICDSKYLFIKHLVSRHRYCGLDIIAASVNSVRYFGNRNRCRFDIPFQLEVFAELIGLITLPFIQVGMYKRKRNGIFSNFYGGISRPGIKAQITVVYKVVVLRLNRQLAARIIQLVSV